MSLIGAGSNVELSTISYVLDHQDYTELAKQYELNMVDMLVSAGVGAFMGTVFWRNPVDVKYDRAYQRVYERYKSDLEAGGKFSQEEIELQAKPNAAAAVSFARMIHIAPDQVDDMAAKLIWTDDRKAFSVPEEYAMMIEKDFETRYNDAIAKGDMKEAERIVKEYAKLRGYTVDEDYRDSHSAPKASVAKEDFTNLDKLRKAANESGDLNLFAIANDVSNVPSDFFTHDGWWQYSNRNEAADSESFFKIRKAIDSIQRQTKEYGTVKHMPSVWVYRAVPKSVKEGSLQSDGQWVTPSMAYAKLHGQSRFGPGNYRIIKEAVPADQLWFDGNSINEWGFDNGEKYVYKNTTNNRKRYDAIVRDFDGNIVPLSKRFNSRKWEEFYQAKKLVTYERKLAEDTAAWGKLVDSYLPNSKSWKGAPKGSGPVPFLRQVPLVFFLTGARPSTVSLKASPHLFDGTHPEMTPEVLKQLPEALANPIALFKSATRVDSYVAMLELKSAQGATIVVPVEINARGVRDSEINIARSAYAKGDSITGMPKDEWFAEQSKKGNLLYVDEEKLNRWRSFAGSNSLWDLSNGHGRTVMHRSDLVKLRESLGNEFYQLGYHGTPYLFDAFTLAHIGSGEGAQAHGWGLYFALSRAVAEGYRKKLKKDYLQEIEITYKGRPFSEFDEAFIEEVRKSSEEVPDANTLEEAQRAYEESLKQSQLLKLNAAAAVSYARMAHIAPDQVDDMAAKIVWTDDRKAFSVPEEYAMPITQGNEWHMGPSPKRNAEEQIPVLKITEAPLGKKMRLLIQRPF